MMKKHPLIVICGPTATGKTDIGIRLSREINGNIISADSRQLYRYMDIGTGKDIKENSKFQIPNSKGQASNIQYQTSNLKPQYIQIGYYTIEGINVWLYDIIEPDKRFSAHEFSEAGWETINHLVNCSITPIIVGGSGLYIKALVDGFDTSSAPDWDMRKVYNNMTVHELQTTLTSLNPRRLYAMNNSDRHNPRRLIRSIEQSTSQAQITDHELLSFLPVCRQAGEGRESRTREANDIIFIGLTAPLDVLYARIEKRVDNRIEQGIIHEIQSLLKRGYVWSDPGLDTVGYKEWRPFIEGRSTQAECISLWKLHERQYARRQLTWFLKDKRITWFDITKCSPDGIVDAIKTMYNDFMC